MKAKDIGTVLVGAGIILLGWSQKYHIAHPAPGDDPHGLMMGCAITVVIGAIVFAIGAIRLGRSHRARIASA